MTIDAEGTRERIVGTGLAAVGAVAFGTNIVLFKVAFRAGATPVSLLTTRLVIAAGILFGYHALTRHTMKIASTRLVQLLLLGAFGFLTGPLLYALAVDLAPVSVVAPLFFTYPLWASLLAVSADLTQLRSELLLSLVLGLAGVALLFSLPRESLIGSFLALSAGFAAALYVVFVQVAIQSVRPSSVAAFTTGAGAILFIGVSAVARDWIPTSALVPAALVGLLTAVGYLATFEAIGRIGAAHSAIVQLVEPVISILLAVAFLTERLTIQIVVATCLILSNLPLIARSEVAGRNLAPPGEIGR